MRAAPDPLSFRCTGCGNCCRALRVAVTAVDVARLATATQRPPGTLVAWLGPDEVDMAGDPASFVELSVGRRLMVLAQVEQACVLLTPDNRCSAYAARPRDCRAFPFDFDAVPGAPRGRVQPQLLPLVPLVPLVRLRADDAESPLDCDYASDAQHDAAELAEQDAQRWLELADFQSLVARWNRLARHRRRLHHAVGNGDAFLRFALDRAALNVSARDAAQLR
jgi:Fe-S-cluster containining protein